MTLSKSNYMDFLKHPAFLWLRKFDKSKIPPIDEATQEIFDAGNTFEFYAEKLYSNAIRIGFDLTNFDTYKSMPKRTQVAIETGSEVIFQGRLEYNNSTCIFDVLQKVKDGENNTFDLIEIKSSSSAKPEHAYDLAFQKYVLSGAGVNIRNSKVLHLNSEYARQGEINVQELITEADISDEVNSLDDITKMQVEQAFQTLELTSCPDLSPKYINSLNIKGTKWKDYWMEVFFYINNQLPETSIYKLCRLTPELVETLEKMEISDIKEIPEDLEGLHERQIDQIKTTKSGEQITDKKSIKEFLDSLEYPLYFLDYETMSSVIPMYDGMHPYRDYPFQYSLHVIDSPNSKTRHTEYLHNEKSNPMPDLLQKLKQDIGNEGTILTWNMIYEISCNNRMAEIYTEYKEFIIDINERIKDLMTPFSEQWFVDKNFYGSASIKKVLPVLVPELNYKELDVSDGLTARRLWMGTVLGGQNPWNREEVLTNLSSYCTLDTYAMVKIFESLHNTLT